MVLIIQLFRCLSKVFSPRILLVQKIGNVDVGDRISGFRRLKQIAATISELTTHSLFLRIMDPSYSAVEGEAYPLYSKKLKLKHFQCFGPTFSSHQE